MFNMSYIIMTTELYTWAFYGTIDCSAADDKEAVLIKSI